MKDSEKTVVHLVQEAMDKPLIRIKAGQLPEIATMAEAAIIKAGLPIYRRGALLVRPVIEEVDAAQGRKATVAVLHACRRVPCCRGHGGRSRVAQDRESD